MPPRQSSRRPHADAFAAAARALSEGRLDAAEKAVRRLLRGAPADPKAHALMVRLLLLRDRPDDALARADAALEATPSAAALHVARMLALRALGRSDAALQALDAAVALAPTAFQPRLERGKLRLSLAQYDAAAADLAKALELAPPGSEAPPLYAAALLEAGDLARAQSVIAAYERRKPAPTVTHQQVLAGLRFKRRDYRGAAEIYQRLTLSAPEDPHAWLGLAAATRMAGDPVASQSVKVATIARFPLVRKTSRTAEARVLVLNKAGLEFQSRHPIGRTSLVNDNFASALEAGRLSYAHAFADHAASIDAALAEGPYDLVLNNLASPEAYRGALSLEQLRETCARFDGTPVLNPPDAVAAATRAENSVRYGEETHFTFPRTVLLDAGAPEAQIAQLLSAQAPPLILRPPATHKGVGASLVEDRAALPEAVAAFKGEPFYAIDYHDCRSPDGLFRRFRGVVIDRAVYPATMLAATGWNVHGDARQGLWTEDRLIDEERRFLDDLPDWLGLPADQAFRELIERQPLDLFGFDFARRRSDGRLIVFEVNAAMAFTSAMLAEAFPYLRPARNRYIAAIEDYLLKRAGAG